MSIFWLKQREIAVYPTANGNAALTIVASYNIIDCTFGYNATVD